MKGLLLGIGICGALILFCRPIRFSGEGTPRPLTRVSRVSDFACDLKNQSNDGGDAAHEMIYTSIKSRCSLAVSAGGDNI